MICVGVAYSKMGYVRVGGRSSCLYFHRVGLYDLPRAQSRQADDVHLRRVQGCTL